MAKINRKTGNLPIFASNTLANEITQFGTTDTEKINTLDELLGSVKEVLLGWSITPVNELPTKEDFNAVFKALFLQGAYTNQMGIAEYDKAQEYVRNSIVNADGDIYISLKDNNINKAITDSGFWQSLQERIVKINAATNDVAGITKIIDALDSNDRLSALSAAQGKILADMIKDAVSNAVPSGAVQYFAMPRAPQGWLEANGGEVSRTQYANLFNAIGTIYGAGNGSTTFNLPDLRGQFIRCLDNGRGADPHSGRGIGSWQDSDNKWHQHSGRTGDSGDHQHFGTTDGAGNHTHSVGKTGGGNGSAAATSYPGNGGELSWSGNHTHGFSTTWNGNHSHGFMSDPSGGSESRPINIALLACIKI